MAQESCDLNKDEAEILKPTSSSPSSPTPTPTPSPTSPPPPPPTAQIPEPPPPQSQSQPPAAQFLSKPCEGVLIEASRKRKTLDAVADARAVSAAEPLSPVLFVNRCNVCRKRIGLSGFRCRCGELFCPRHRHSETHDCSFDYKTAGREEIARANPVIRAAKIIKI